MTRNIHGNTGATEHDMMPEISTGHQSTICKGLGFLAADRSAILADMVGKLDNPKPVQEGCTLVIRQLSPQV